jgi:hypothetical protein
MIPIRVSWIPYIAAGFTAFYLFVALPMNRSMKRQRDELARRNQQLRQQHPTTDSRDTQNDW